MAEETRKYSEDADLIFEKLRKLIGQSGFQIDKVDETNKRLLLSTGMSLLSYGESIEIIVNRNKVGSTVYVNSKPKAWFNITAQPSTERNVRRVFEMLDKQFK
jgi:hypothetical protein